MKGFKNPPVENSNTDVMDSRNPQLRLFTLKRASSFTPKTDVVGTWQEAVTAVSYTHLHSLLYRQVCWRNLP